MLEHYGVELLLANFLTLLYLIFESVDSSNVFTLFLVSFLLSKVLDGLVELSVLLLALLFLELLNLHLLFEKAALNEFHVIICLNHFCEVVIWPVDGNIGLHAYFHSLHDVVASNIIKRNFTFNVIVDIEGCCSVRNLNGVLVLNSHVFHEWDFTLLFNQLSRFKPVVEALLDLMESLVDLLFIHNRFESESIKSCLFILLVCHCLHF